MKTIPLDCSCQVDDEQAELSDPSELGDDGPQLFPWQFVVSVFAFVGGKQYQLITTQVVHTEKQLNETAAQYTARIQMDSIRALACGRFGLCRIK